MPAPGFKIGDAFAFARAKGLLEELERIRSLVIHPAAGKRAVVQKGHFVDLFETSGLIDEFVAKYWPLRATPSGLRL